MRIVLATHNPGKVPELRAILRESIGEAFDDVELTTAGELGLPDPVETGVTFSENALLKARFVAEKSGSPAIADDSGLIVDVMGQAPGILSARWAGKHGDSAANNALLLAQISDIPDEKRTARFMCAAALVIPGENGAREVVETGECPGRVLREEKGEKGFGYDPLFLPDEQTDPEHPLTFAQMSEQQKDAISHRGKAMRKLAADVTSLLF